MRKIQGYRLTAILLAFFSIALVTVAYGQDTAKATTDEATVQTNPVPAGQKMSVEGVVLSQQPDGIVMRSLGGANYKVSISDSAEIKEKKSNFLRGARKYSKRDLVTGLRVEVKGIGDSSGA